MKTLVAFVLSVIFFLPLSVLAGQEYQRPSDAEIKQQLTPLQYYVTQQQGTERAYQNVYLNNKRAGIYVDIVSGEPLFSSLDKYDSRTGWPSFTKPLVVDNVITQVDRSWFMTRTELVSKHGRSHLGHLFKDGPAPDYNRYCINSAALDFIPVKDLKKRGYSQYLKLFK